MSQPSAPPQVLPEAVDAFIVRWKTAGGSERANYQLFLSELVALLDLPRPDPARDDTRDNAYVFERRVTFQHGDGTESSGFINLYRCGAFVLEAKKLRPAGSGTGWDDATYNKTRCFNPFPFPLPSTEQRQRIANLAEQLDGTGGRRDNGVVAAALSASSSPLTADDVVMRFSGRGPKARVPQLLDMLAALGRARAVGDGRYVS